jgi:tetratricopeptide (TPR) repeat protein
LGGVYFNLNEFQSSKEYFEKASGLKPQSELASLGLYLSYIELENFEKAIEELKRFLDKYPAELYKTTLGELLEDMENGYALTFKETILPLAKRNGLI